jgi:crotonobetainyl-CoA:carnitine CoA-transferase CaiB-like acyl-CoA transferase
MSPARAPAAILADLWQHGGLPAQALGHATLTGIDPVFPSSFAVGAAAQTSIAAAALAACELGHWRGQSRQKVAVDMAPAALECTGWFSLNGQVPALWDKFSGLYACADGWVRIHTNFAHHRDGALRLMGLQPHTATRADAEQAMRAWRASEFEQAAADAGLVVAALRSFDEWDAHPQGQAVAALPLMTFERMGDAPPMALPPLAALDGPLARPLSGLRVLDLTRILAGPVCGRALAAYGADVMLVNAPHLPNIESIADTSRGKLSAHVDLRTAEGKAQLAALARQAQVFVQGYRPGALDSLGFGPQDVARLRPGVVCVSLSAYGHTGPWQARRGFDSLVQTAMGFNHAEGVAAAAADGSSSAAPKPLPMQILDYATGHLMAFAACAALHRQAREGGSWHVRLSLAQTGQWLRGLGRVQGGLGAKPPDRRPHLETSASGFGELVGLRHSAQLAAAPCGWRRPSVPPGTHPASWPTSAPEDE